MKYYFLIIALVLIAGTFQLTGESTDNTASKTALYGNNLENQQTGYWYKLIDSSQKIFNKIYSSLQGFTTKSIRHDNQNNDVLLAKGSKKISDNHSIIIPSEAFENFANRTGVPNIRTHIPINGFAENDVIPNSNPTVTANSDKASDNSAGKAGVDNIQTYIYISEFAGNDVVRCRLEQGNVSNCKVALSNITGPQDMVIVGNKFYLVTYNPQSVISCDLVLGGDIESCTQTALPSKSLAYIMYTNNRLNITSMDLKNAVQCNLDYNFLVQNCFLIPPIISPDLADSPNRLFNTAGYLGYTYFTLYNLKQGTLVVSKCTGNVCSILHDPHLSGPNSIKILNNMAYLTDGDTDSLVFCMIEPSGDFAPCKVLRSGLKIPVAIAFYFITS